MWNFFMLFEENTDPSEKKQVSIRFQKNVETFIHLALPHLFAIPRIFSRRTEVL